MTLEEQINRDVMPKLSCTGDFGGESVKAIADFVLAAVAEERSQCAIIADRASGRMDCDLATAKWILDQIRLRKVQP